MSAIENKKVVDQMWETLYRKDWEGLKGFFTDESHYEDVPTPDPGAFGSDNIVKRLQIGLEPIVRFEHDVHRVVAEGDNVVIEHTESWHFETGEKLVNHFSTIHVVKHGKILLWRDYWDLNTLMAQAPQWWIERLAKFGDGNFA